MSHFTHGGRIVPILTGTDSHDPNLEMSTILEGSLSSITPPPISPSIPPSTMPRLLQDQQVKRAKPVQDASLEMASLKERGLYALPTEGDGKSFTH